MKIFLRFFYVIRCSTRLLDSQSMFKNYKSSTFGSNFLETFTNSFHRHLILTSNKMSFECDKVQNGFLSGKLFIIDT